MMRIICVLVLTCMSFNFLNAQEINEKAKKYFDILSSKPSPGFMFDRFYGAWMESSDTRELEEYLKKNSVEKPTSENILLLAFYYQKEGQTNKALEILGSVEDQKLLTGEVLYYQARLESSALNFTNAIQHIDKAIASPIKDDLKQKLLKLKAQVQYRDGNSKGARETFETLLAVNEKDKTIIEDIMEIQLAEGAYEDAKKHCQTLMDLSTDNYEKVSYQLKMATILKRLNDSENSEKIYLDLIGLSGQDSWLLKEVVYQFESISRGKDNLTDLVKKYKEIIKNNPQNVYLRKRYSSLLSEKGEKDTAINEFKAIVELLPGDKSIREEYASLLISNGKTEEAIKVLEYLVTSKSGSKDYEVILNIADLEFKNKRLSQANEWLQQFLAKKDLTEYEILRASNLLHKHDQVAKEIELLEKYAKEKPEAIGIKESLVSLYLEGKDKEKALQVVKTLNVSDDLDLNFRIISQLIKQKLSEDALVILESANKENKETYKYQKRLFDLYSDLENEGKKKEIAKSILNFCTSFVEIREAIQTIINLYKEDDLAVVINDLDAKKELNFKDIMLLANLRYKVNQSDLVFTLIEEANKKYGDEILFLELQESFFSSIREFERAVQVVDELIKKSPKDNSKYLLLKMNLHKRSGEIDDAIICAKQLIIATNSKPEHVIALADLYQLRGESSNAIAVLRKASFENAEEKEFKIKLVDSYMRDQNFSDARRMLWSLLEATEDTTEKISHLDKLFNCYDYDLGLDALLENLKERKLNNAQSTFPLLALIRVYQRLNDTENRSKYMVELAQLKADDVQLYLELADVMEKDLDYEGAEINLKKAVELDKGELARSKLVKFYFNIGKDEQAVIELLRVSEKTFNEKQIIDIAEKYIVEEKPEKAYGFLKKYVPADKTEVYDYILAIAAREAKVENAEMHFYRLLDKNEEFSKTPMPTLQANHSVNERYLPEMFKAHDAFRRNLWVYASHKASRRDIFMSGSSYSVAVSNQHRVMISIPSNLSQLHYFAIAHLGDIYREGSDAQKTEILKELKKRNIEYAELLLSIDKNKTNFGAETAYKDLSSKYPENVELKVLSLINDREYYNSVGEKLLPLINDVKEKDAKLALWLYLSYGLAFSEINQEIISDAESLMSKLAVSEDVRCNMYFVLFANENHRPKVIDNDLIEKYKPIMLSMIDKSMAKDVSGFRYNDYMIMATLAKFGDVERYAKIVNRQLSSSATRNQNFNSNPYGRRRSMGASWGEDARFPDILHQRISHQNGELYNLNSNHISNDFRKELIPFIENKYLKLSMHLFLKNEEETEKIIKDLAESKSLDDLQIVVAYYASKKKDKEAFVALSKALPLATTIDVKKSINARIVFYATKTDDPMIKAEGVRAGKRLRDFNLNKEELLELSISFDSLGETAEAQKLDEKIRKMNTSLVRAQSHFSSSVQTSIGGKLETMFNSGKNDASFKFLISILKNNFARFSDRVKNASSFQFDSYGFNNIMKMVKNKNISVEFKRFVSEQSLLSDDDLVTIAFIFLKLDEAEEAVHIAKKLVEKKPRDLVYKMLAYSLNVKKNKELDDDLKQAINKNVVESLLILRNFMSHVQLFDVNFHELKEVALYIFDNIEGKEEYTLLYRDVFILPFFSSASLTKNVSVESILNVKSKRKDLKKDDQKIYDDHYTFFEELMLKSIKNKLDPMNAGSALIHYYAINQMPISSETIQVFSDAVVEDSKRNQKVSYPNYTSNGDSLLPLPYSLPIYLLNQNKRKELDAIYERLIGDEGKKYKKVIDKLKLFYVEEPITDKDVLELDRSFDFYGHRSSILSILSSLLQKMDVRNSHVHDLLLANIREVLAKKDRNNYISSSVFMKHLGRQIKTLSGEDAVNYLLDIEKRILPEPFDKDLFEKNKNNWDHHTRRLSAMFAFDQRNDFDANLYKHVLKASQKSEFYFHLARLSSNYLWRMGELSADDLLASGLFSGSLSEFSIVKFDHQNFLANRVIGRLKEGKREDMLEKLGKMQQTDGVKLLSLWVGDKSYENVFDFLGSKLTEFNALPTAQKTEWIEFLKNLYKYELSKNQTLSDLGNEFKSVIDDLGKVKIDEMTKMFFDEKYDEDIKSHQIFDILNEIYPSVLLETEEKILTAMKSVWRKYRLHRKNHTYGYGDHYQHDDFIRRVIGMESSHRNHLVVATELLKQNLKWPPDYYRRYSSIAMGYMKQRAFALIEKLGVEKDTSGRYVLNTEQEKALKLELNAVVDDVVAINKNLVPIYMTAFSGELRTIDSRNAVFKALMADWDAEEKLSDLKKDIYFDFKSSVENNKSILENHFIDRVTDPSIIPQIKSDYIQLVLSNSALSKEKKKIILDQHLKSTISDSSNFSRNPQEFYRLIDRYDYETLKESPEFPKAIRGWYSSFEKALAESYKDEWRLNSYSINSISNLDTHQKMINIMKDHFDEKTTTNFFKINKLGFRLYSPMYMTFIKEGLESIVLDALNGNIEEIRIDSYRLNNLSLTTEDLGIIEKLVEKIIDPEKRRFAKILFYRIGTKTQSHGHGKSFDLFTRSLKEMIEDPIENEGIRKKLLDLLSGTPLSSDKEITQILKGSIEDFDENKLKTHPYQEIGVSFRLYCKKFSQTLVDKGLEQLKEEVDKTLANIKERKDNADMFVLTISDSLAKNLHSDKNIIDNANAYYKAISYVLDVFDHARKDGKLGFSYALCLLFLDNKADQLPAFFERYKHQHIFHWEKKLSTVEAIQLFKTAYLQSPEKSENVVKSLNDFLTSKANDYYDYLSDENSKSLFDFIKTDVDKKKIIESYKQFNQKEKNK